ncbi:MAG: MBL fold metallo-hydrolase [Longimicrobiales bacterium]
MKITFWGAARTVTGSMHLVELENGSRVLLDCGLYQGRRSEARKINEELPFDGRAIDVVLLSHAHIDHSGLLPLLYRRGFRGRIYATHATYDLCALMLLDSAYIQEKDASYVNRRNRKRKRDEPEVQPLYAMEDAEKVLDLFVGVGYGQEFDPVPGMKVEYRDAGHILGSATISITVEEGGKTKRVGFTGDVGRTGRPILRDPVTMADCDFLITESTYGGKVHDPPEESKRRLREVVRGTAQRGGKVIIPAFAVGRTQEIVYILDQLENEGTLAPIPAYVDSPLAVNVTGVYQVHPECYDRDLRDYLLQDPNPFGFERLTYVRHVEESKRLNASSLPMVIISASGMCEAGRILHHLRHAVSDPKNTILMVGYCADHTLGKRLIERREEVKIFGEPYRLRSEVVVMNSYSAHADEPELLEFIGGLDRDRLKQVALVHGAPVRQAALKEAMTAKGYHDIIVPERGDSVQL